MAAYQYVFVMQNLTKVFPGGKELFKGITLSFLPGAKIGVLGVNGAGKSTLLKIMAGVDKEFNGEAWAADGVKVGYLETNCYILENELESLIIDPGDEPIKIEKEITKKLIGIIITHSHFDHIGGIDYFKEKYDVPVYDYNSLKEGLNNIGSFSFEVIHTLGHTNDSITVYFKEEKVMFVGDFIFKNGIGRVDLPGGDILEMQKSLSKIKKYDKDIIIYPGHGDYTKIKDEFYS
jgi:glyoxylase-like metal-dependent hydrolase (beta-lactamase superfamily II)